MFDKITTVGIEKKDIFVLDNEMCKVASNDLFPGGTAYDPDFLYMVLRSVSAGEYWGSNNNADYFPESELLGSVDSFLDAHAFQNHDNKLVAAAIGDVLKSAWNDKMKCIDLMIRIDRSIAPSIVRGYEKGFLTDVSMGCKVKHSICSICGNKAVTEKQFCEHITKTSGNRNRIYPDGRKSYEINIGPRFHDISSVLRGADKTAKITGILIVNGKVANIDAGDINTMEKAASMEYAIADGGRVFFQGVSFDANREIAVPQRPMLEKTAEQDEILEGMKKHFGEPKSALLKFAEMKKEITSKIVALSAMGHNAKNLSEVDSLTDLIKMFHTDYWGEDICDEIAEKIKEQADKVSMPISEAFVKFVHALELSGIELSPREVAMITDRLLGEENKRSAFDVAIDNAKNENLINLALRAKNDSFEYGSDVPARVYMFVRRKNMLRPDAISGVPGGWGSFLRNLMQYASEGLNFSEAKDQYSDMTIGEFIKMLRPHMPARSFKRQFLLPRIKSIIDDKDDPRPTFIRHFAYPSVLLSKEASLFDDAMSAYSYAVYQHERGEYVNSENYEDDLSKFASEINEGGFIEAALKDAGSKMEKKAMNSLTKARIAALPVTFGYSAMQRARIKSGERVSPVNRWIAESPGSAYAVQLAVPALVRSTGKFFKGKAVQKKLSMNIKSTVGKAIKEAKTQGKVLSKKEIKKIVDGEFGRGITDRYVDMEKVKRIFKKAEDADYAFIFEKDAEALDDFIDEPMENFINRTGFDVFTSNKILEKLSSDYSREQIDAMKIALMRQYQGRQDQADSVLWNNGLSEEDLSSYLKCAGEVAYEELEKYSSEAGDVMLSAGQDVLFNPVNSSAAVLFPGNILDGIIFNKLFNKKTKKAKAQPPQGISAEGAKEVFDNGKH